MREKASFPSQRNKNQSQGGRVGFCTGTHVAVSEDGWTNFDFYFSPGCQEQEPTCDFTYKLFKLQFWWRHQTILASKAALGRDFAFLCRKRIKFWKVCCWSRSLVALFWRPAHDGAIAGNRPLFHSGSPSTFPQISLLSGPLKHFLWKLPVGNGAYLLGPIHFSLSWRPDI